MFLLSELTDILKNFGGLASAILSISAVLGIISPHIRKCVVSNLKKSLNIDEINKKIDDIIISNSKRDVDIQNVGSQVLALQQMTTAHVEAQTKTEEIQNETDLFNIRNQIIDTYYKYMPLLYLPQYKRENLIRGFDIYTKKNGNSYIKSMVEELLELEIKL